MVSRATQTHWYGRSESRRRTNSRNMEHPRSVEKATGRKRMRPPSEEDTKSSMRDTSWHERRQRQERQQHEEKLGRRRPEARKQDGEQPTQNVGRPLSATIKRPRWPEREDWHDRQQQEEARRSHGTSRRSTGQPARQAACPSRKTIGTCWQERQEQEVHPPSSQSTSKRNVGHPA